MYTEELVSFALSLVYEELPAHRRDRKALGAERRVARCCKRKA